MLHTAPFAVIEHVHLVQPFVHRITERTIEIAVENDPRLDHSVSSPYESCRTFASVRGYRTDACERYPLSLIAVKLPAYESRVEGEQTVAEDAGSDLAMTEVGLCEEALQCCTEGWEGHWFRDDVIHSGLSALLCVLR